MATLDDASVGGAYLACLSALAIWGWVEIAFLSGVIAGPNTRPLPANVSESERFIRSWGTIAYHEMLLVAALGLIAFAAWDAPNGFGLWTFIILFFARISAKLNLFFGVPRIHVEFLPKPLAHVPSHFRVATLNWVFPFSVTALAFAVACWMERIYAAETAADAVGFTLLATLTALALLEHWLMILPLPDERLWRWMLPSSETTTKTNHNKIPRPREDAHGL